MSESILKLIPTNPNYVPSDQIIKKVRNLFPSIFPHAQRFDFRTAENVEFIDPGANFESVSCPFCGSPVDISWWQEAMDQAAGNKFSDLKINTPCCGKSSSLNNLIYNWPAGFAKFTLSVIDPGHDPADEEIHALEDALQCRVKKIIAHY
ncbi:hypothetical protein HZA87_00905 [Candidatus Uhrbacteria bacterium]|nr:hypothetical protein [Candidatus Uhrbacteria bacterium]